MNKKQREMRDQESKDIDDLFMRIEELDKQVSSLTDSLKDEHREKGWWMQEFQKYNCSDVIEKEDIMALISEVEEVAEIRTKSQLTDFYNKVKGKK